MPESELIGLGLVDAQSGAAWNGRGFIEFSLANEKFAVVIDDYLGGFCPLISVKAPFDETV
jgi:hypothetical protein